MEMMKITILVNLKHGNVGDLWEYLGYMGILDNERMRIVDILEST